MPSRVSTEGATRPKRPFDFDVALPAIRERLKTSDLADAAMFELRDGSDGHPGYGALFQQLVACIISIRTRDEVSLPVARRLFEVAPTPARVASLAESEIERLIHAATFPQGKARTIREIARRTAEEFGGTLPCDFELLTSFHGVGPKCANLALGVACGEARIAVDIHVHRVSNRWGVISTGSPIRSMEALEGVLPKKYWIEINRLLVPFGKHVCTGTLPKCSTCPVLAMCRQVGVTASR